MTTAIEAWRVECFQSGTMIVSDANAAQHKVPFVWGVNSQSPWLYVHGPGYENDDDAQQARYKLCEQLAAFLNGGARPEWLDDLVRVMESRAIDIDGTSITAVGPMVDAKPPACVWEHYDNEDARNARARLMDRLFLS